MDYDDVNVERRPDGVDLLFTRAADAERGTYHPVARLAVRFETDTQGTRGISDVQLKVYEGRLTATAIKRFAWSRWLKAAEVIDSTPQPSGFLPAGDIDVMGRIRARDEEWYEYANKIRATIAHPGSRGRSPGDYERIAALYAKLVTAGEPAPIKRLSEELGVSRHTISGLVRKARQMALLPAGQKGKAG